MLFLFSRESGSFVEADVTLTNLFVFFVLKTHLHVWSDRNDLKLRKSSMMFGRIGNVQRHTRKGRGCSIQRRLHIYLDSKQSAYCLSLRSNRTDALQVLLIESWDNQALCSAVISQAEVWNEFWPPHFPHSRYVSLSAISPGDTIHTRFFSFSLHTSTLTCWSAIYKEKLWNMSHVW